MDGVMGTR